VKYLVLGAVASAFLVYGIALVYGGAGTLRFTQLAATTATGAPSGGLLSLGLLLVFAGLSFKIAAAPFQVWAPDVYQGAPAPTTAFLAVGSKAAGFVLLLRVLHLAAPGITVHWTRLLAVVAALTILYGNLCAIPQRNLKRLLGYSSIAHAGYLLLGVVAWSADGAAAILYYLSGYLFTLAAAFAVICVALRGVEDEDVGALAGLHRRSPLLGASLALAMISLAGVPPLAGFFGKFLLLKSVVARAGAIPGSYVLLGVALAGIVISLYYYFGVVRAIYWLPATQDVSAIEVPRPMRWMLYACIAGMLWLGIFPSSVVNLADHAVRATLKW
jgi:NADH-quinone oxidoreductase subunit N